MGAIIFSVRTYLDTIVDIVGIKSGLILSYSELIDILKEQGLPDYSNKNLESIIRIRSEEFEEDVRSVRVQIGNLKPEMPKLFTFSPKFLEWEKNGIDTVILLQGLSEVSKKYAFRNVNEKVFLAELKDATKLPDHLLFDLMKLIYEFQFQSSHITIPERKEWQGGIYLQNLFNCELKPSNNEFLEQKFLDYLAINSDKITSIHWRNFERFCAEFFNRLGYKVDLGGGTNDGGVDIRAYDKNELSKPLILIQCKRYKLKNKIEIETIKSFYTDVVFENAERGIIITSSHISKGGKKVTEARGYPLSFAENEDVRIWANQMWRYN